MSGSKLLLILGSGFSKAVFPDIMPTVKELAPCLEAEKALRQEPYKHLVGDPELLLTYLSLAQPWKTPAEALNDEALFIKVANRLADYIARCEDAAFKHSVPGWASDLVQSLHEQRVPVISLNYDTIIERLLERADSEASTRDGWPHERDLYGLPLSPLGLRESGANQPQEIETSRLIKLHGSINWFYSGAEGWPGEQVYFRPVDTDSPLQDGRGPSSASSQQYTRLVKDKIPLIIPPVAEKSRFYSNRTIRILWSDARNALEEADVVLCVGYSLPKTDLTMKLFLQSAAQPKRVVIVNKEPDKELADRYQDAFPKSDLDGKSYSDGNSVERMAKDILARIFS